MGHGHAVGRSEGGGGNGAKYGAEIGRALGLRRDLGEGVTLGVLVGLPVAVGVTAGVVVGVTLGEPVAVGGRTRWRTQIADATRAYRLSSDASGARGRGGSRRGWGRKRCQVRRLNRPRHRCSRAWPGSRSGTCRRQRRVTGWTAQEAFVVPC